MSAYAALQGGSSITDFFEGSEESETIQYEKNSSDEDLGTDVEKEANRIQESKNSSQGIPLSLSKNLLSSKAHVSKFSPSDDNLIVLNDYITVGLKVNEYILLEGQCYLTILRGAAMINNLHYIQAHPDKRLTIYAPKSQSFPVISSTQVIDRSEIQDSRTPENEHLFSNSFKTVIKLENLFSGLENIGNYYSPFRSLFHSNAFKDEDELDEYELLFQTYSFRIIFNPSNTPGIQTENVWSNEIHELVEKSATEPDPQIFMAVGNKNSGKSTLTKTIMNAIILRTKGTVAYLDMDPGQSEFSIPYTLSLCTFSSPIIGSNIIKMNDDSRISYYYGFTTPQVQPEQYCRIIKALFRDFSLRYKPKGIPLLINTPGWVKGYGKELLIELTRELSPDVLLLLSNNLDVNSPDNMEISSGLTYGSIMNFPAIYQLSKYSSHQLRTFNKLVYFHEEDEINFRFETHMLSSSPLKLSYHTHEFNDFKGISLVCILNYDTDISFNLEDLVSMIEATMFGVYLVENEFFVNAISPLMRYVENESIPFYLNSSDYCRLIDYDASVFNFVGLCIVHSVNTEGQFLNLYMPKFVENVIQDMMVKKDYKLILTRGEGEIPSSEFIMPELLLAQQKQMREQNKKGKGLNNISKIPYVSFDSKSRVGGVWKIRRNVMRRGHNIK